MIRLTYSNPPSRYQNATASGTLRFWSAVEPAYRGIPLEVPVPAASAAGWQSGERAAEDAAAHRRHAADAVVERYRD
jgi:hypothetical protein